MIELLLFAFIVGNPVYAEKIVRADDVDRLEALISTQAAAIQELQARLSASESTIRSQQSQISQQDASIRQLQDNAHTQGRTVGFTVDFGAEPYHNVQLSTSDPVLFNHVVSNVGSAYDPATGYFTAPYRGLYFFHLQFMGGNHNNQTDLSINVDNTTVAVAFADGYLLDPNDQGSCTAVVQLLGGEKVSVKYYYGALDIWGSTLTSFTGALIHPE